MPSNKDHCKVAKVHTWLKNKSYSDLDQIQSDDHAHSQGHTSLNDHAPLHVHFADDCACADDTKSIGSSHTSGIVTDYPMSPKLLPSCCCQQCTSHELGEFPDLHCHMDHDVLSMPSGGPAESVAVSGIDQCSSSSESTLRPLSSTSVHTAPPNMQRSIMTENVDATINKPPTTRLKRHSVSSANPVRWSLLNGGSRDVTGFKVARSLSHLSHYRVRTHASGRGEGVNGRWEFLDNSETNGACPDAPTDVCVSESGRRGETLVVSWKPVKYVSLSAVHMGSGTNLIPLRMKPLKESNLSLQPSAHLINLNKFWLHALCGGGAHPHCCDLTATRSASTASSFTKFS